jgi:hypothetical protein
VATLCAQETTERNPGRVLFAFLFNSVLLWELLYAEKILVLENKWGTFYPVLELTLSPVKILCAVIIGRGSGRTANRIRSPR